MVGHTIARSPPAAPRTRCAASAHTPMNQTPSPILFRPKRSTPSRCPTLSTLPGTSGATSRLASQGPLRDRDCAWSSRDQQCPFLVPWYPTHPPPQGRAKRCSDWRLREPGPSRSGLSPTRPTRRPKRSSSTQCPSHPPAQGRAKRCPDWRLREPPTFTIGTVPNPTDPLAKTRPPRLVPHPPTRPGTSEATSRLALQRTPAFTIGTAPSTESSAIQRSSAPRGTGRRGGGGGPGTEARASPVEACPGGERSRLGPRGGAGGGRVRR